MSLDDAIAELWRSAAPAVRERLGLVDAAVAELSAGALSPATREAAVGAAHKLAGSLGSFGVPGSPEAFLLEAELAAPAPSLDRLAALAARLRALVEPRL